MPNFVAIGLGQTVAEL